MSYQRNKYIAPDPADLPESLRPLVDELNTLRERWRTAAERADQARAELRGAPARFATAVISAAKEGKDATEVPDPLPGLARDLEVRELAEQGVRQAVQETWWRLWNAVTTDYTEVAAFCDKPAAKATDKVLKAEAALAAARAELSHAMGVRMWISERQTLKSGDYIAVNGNGPRNPDVDSGSLSTLHAAEAKARGLREQEAAMKQIARQRQADADAEYEKRKAEQTRRREATRLR